MAEMKVQTSLGCTTESGTPPDTEQMTTVWWRVPQPTGSQSAALG